MSRQPPVQQPPPVQKLWVRYAKRGVGRFASHRDFARAFERALRRAHVPMAYSSGFNPHPRISWANPAPTGAESESEYVEIGLAEAVEPGELAAALGAAFPPGFAVVAVGPAGPSLMADLEASEWEVTLGAAGAVDLADAVARFLAADEALVTRETKNGPRTFDARAAVVTLEAAPPGLHAVLRHTVPLVRPDDLVTALAQFGVTPPDAPLTQRLAQGRLIGTQVLDPLV
ncbi:MAG: TIGR03936 family radical SAM-associated protein [Propionibacteriaceae bacterium]|jgi:radical SAM-linked protein|nr:TIGR03936 family radical SAM-associated protein [Propionibacteriaceae bacterium]